MFHNKAIEHSCEEEADELKLRPIEETGDLQMAEEQRPDDQVFFPVLTDSDNIQLFEDCHLQQTNDNAYMQAIENEIDQSQYATDYTDHLQTVESNANYVPLFDDGNGHNESQLITV